MQEPFTKKVELINIQVYNTHAFIFRRLDKKHKLLGKFEKILKIFDENSIEKLNFIMIFGKFVTKNRASEITPFFYNNFFGFGGDPPLPPPLNPPMLVKLFKIAKISFVFSFKFS